MLEADEIERLAIYEFGGGAIVGHLALPDCLADGWRKFVVAARLDQRDNGRIRNLAERADREFEVGREGGYAAAAREGIADERDPQRRRVQAISVLAFRFGGHFHRRRSEEHTSELQSLMRISYAVFCLKKKKQTKHKQRTMHDSKQTT